MRSAVTVPRAVRVAAASACIAGLLGTCLAACSSPSDAARPGVVPVVASTNVWGDIARQIGGRSVDVTSLIDDPGRDPHSFRPSGRDELAVSRARVVIENGGGYDDFVGRMLRATDSRAAVVDAVDTASQAGLEMHGNEHVWMSPEAVAAVAERVTGVLSQAAPEHRSRFRAADHRLKGSLEGLHHRLVRLRAAMGGQPVAVTEPVALPLVRAAGLHNVMPAAVTDAVEEGIDVAPSRLSDAEALLTDHRVRVLLYNRQSLTGQVRALLDAAHQGGVPTVAVSELMPNARIHYQRWMGRTAGALADALRQKDP
jgi:zinc/manganese transport system substrate-binding protein